jgi:hypothetical protein
MYNFTLFRPHLYIYEDRVIYKKRHILTHDEFSVTYNHISQVNLIRFIYLYAHIEVATTGVRDFEVRWIRKPKAIKAKKIIDQKVHAAYLTSKKKEEPKSEVKAFELSLSRLKELVNMGRITSKEFNKKRKELLKKHF